MLKILKYKKAQTIMGEYLLIFFLIIGVATAMTIYFRRVVQARIRDARVTMIDIVRSRTNVLVNGKPAYAGPLFYEYEPYYLNAITNSMRSDTLRDGLGSGGSSGIATQSLDEFRRAATRSDTAAPKDADTLEPVGVH